MVRLLFLAAAVADGLFSLFIFFPLAVLYWRGTWGLQCLYFFPSHELASVWLSFLLGSTGCLLLKASQYYVFNVWMINQSAMMSYTVTRLYLYISGWMVMCYWRGVWYGLDYYLTAGWLNSVLLFIIAQVISIFTKTTRDSVGLPFLVSLDSDRSLYIVEIEAAEETSTITMVIQFLRRACLEQFVMATSSICLWRGMWNVFDTFVYPQDVLYSDLVSLVGGYSLSLLMLSLQWPLGFISGKLETVHKNYSLIFEDTVFLILVWITLLLWRGSWNLCVLYVIPQPVLGEWLSHWGGTIGLILLQVFNSVSLNSPDIDGQYNNGDGLFPTDYLRTLYKKKFPLDKKIGVTVDSLLPSSTVSHQNGSESYVSEDTCETKISDIERKPVTS